MPKKKSNWQQLQDMGPKADLKYRDVHGTQRFDRAEIEDRKSRVPRTMFSAILGIIAGVGAYLLFSAIVSGGAYLMGGYQGDFAIDFSPTVIRLLASFAVGGVVFSTIHFYLMRQLKAQDAMSDTSDINQHFGDQRIALVEEIQRNYDWFPDAGAHSAVDANSLLSHMALSNKGLRYVDVVHRYKEDVFDEDGEIANYAGEAVTDGDGENVVDSKPMVDEKFMEGLFDASGALKDKKARKRFDAGKIPYNLNNENRDKLKGYDTVADLINKEWEFPEYEVQRPGGAYIVDTAPVNTMVLAITRAGKGQTYIEPMIDIWSRMKRLNNMVVNDPKGELLKKTYVPNTVRGLQVVQFNLMNPIRTDIFNPLSPAVQAAREGDYSKCAEYVKNITAVFFPVDGAQDPLWPNAARNASMRSIYGLIDYYLEEEKELRVQAEAERMDAKALDTTLDQMWGQVTLYNAYQMLTLLASKNLPNPVAELQKKQKATAASLQAMMRQAENEPGNRQLAEAMISLKKELLDMDDEIADLYHGGGGFLWEDKATVDALTLFFNASRSLPRSPMRVLVVDADSSLKTMAAAEKMLGSVYGVAVTEMAFFSDPTISTLTSGTPSQNVDLASLAFPRCFGVRFTYNFMQKKKLAGMLAKWDAFTDIMFTEELDPKLFRHEDAVSREGWARYYFDGKFTSDIGFVRLRVFDEATQMPVVSFYFQFTKGYKRSLDGRFYINDPILDERIINGGILEELLPHKKEDGSIVYSKGKLCMKENRIESVADAGKVEQVFVPVVRQTSCRYTEKPKAVYMVTPPHLMQYAKIILILIKQLVDLNFGQSYLTKASQKPLYKTHFMLDEVGNLQSDGHGIDGLQTMLSIGLGQDQLFTLILQTLQQLRDVYGDSVDRVIQGNVSNIIFLKSTDDSMIDTLVKMSGTTHRIYRDTKSVTRDLVTVVNKNEDKVTYTVTTKEEPVIKFNDFMWLPERNSIVFRAGDPPIWNRNETILPMSWKLFENHLINPGREYSLRNVPTTSTAIDFDVRRNTPDFMAMVDKRVKQAGRSEQAEAAFQEAYGYSDLEMTRMDPEVLSDEIMRVVQVLVGRKASTWAEKKAAEEKEADFLRRAATENSDYAEGLAEAESASKHGTEKIYADKLLSRNDLVKNGLHNRGWDSALIGAYRGSMQYFMTDTNYRVADDKSLFSAEGVAFITRQDNEALHRRMMESSADRDSGVYADEPAAAPVEGFIVEDAFRLHLTSLSNWKGVAKGEFEMKLVNILS